MSSLADEISKLHQLHVAGILSAEEFADAKKSLITGNTNSSASLPQQSSSQQQNSIVKNPQSALPTPSINFAPDISGFEPSHIGIHSIVYGHLQTILQNILNNPNEQKYRRLRRSNPKLASELFSHLGAELLLLSLGFVDVKEGNGLENEFLVLPIAGQSSSKADQETPTQVDDIPTQIEKIRLTLATLQDLQRRDENAAMEAVNAAKLLRNVSLDIRHEQCRRVALANSKPSPMSSSSAANTNSTPQHRHPALDRMSSLDAFLANLFLVDDLDGEGVSASESVKRLITVEENALKALTAQTKQEYDTYSKFLRMPLANIAASKLVLGQKGAVESLVERGGWVLRGTPVGSSKVSEIWGPSSSEDGFVVTQQTTSASATQLLSSGVPHDIILTAPFEDTSRRSVLVSKAKGLIELYHSIHKLITDVAKAKAMREREEALQHMRIEMQKSLAEERNQKKKVKALLSSNDNGVAGGEEHQHGSGVRIKTADAIRILLGKETKEDVLERAAQRALADAKAPPASAQSRLLAHYDQNKTQTNKFEERENSAIDNDVNDQANAPPSIGPAGDFDSDWSDS